MSRNLDVSKYKNGDTIPQVTNPSEWDTLTTGAYCYYNNDSAKYASIYGKLYNWYAVNDPRGLAPSGWRIPTKSDIIALHSCMGGDGGLLKDSGTIYWEYPNVNATNRSGFTALPGGNRLVSNGFIYLRFRGMWWSSSEYDTLNAWDLHLYYGNPAIHVQSHDKHTGYSVRCIKD